ncbi:MAG TPA: TolC family protein [Mucilaginibacter sp.]|jgi:outer membrane protein TolC
MNNKIKFFFLLIFLLSASKIYAQETMFQDLSYTYLEKLIAAAKKNYPHMKAMDHQVNIAKGTFHQSNFGWLEAFSAGYIYNPQGYLNYHNPTLDRGYQLLASVNLGQLFERPYTIHNAREAVVVAEQQKEEYTLALEAQVKRSYFAYIEAQAELRSRVNAVTDATNAVKNLKHNFEKGETSFQVYNEAVTNLNNQNAFRLQAELAVFTAKTNIEELIGDKLESIK